MGRDGEHWHAIAMTIEESIDQVQIARTTGARTRGESAGEVRFCTSRKCARLLVAHMHPLNAPLPAQRVGDAVQAVTDYPIDTLYTRHRQGLSNLVRYRFGHKHCSVVSSAAYLRLWVATVALLVRVSLERPCLRTGTKALSAATVRAVFMQTLLSIGP